MVRVVDANVGGVGFRRTCGELPLGTRAAKASGDS